MNDLSVTQETERPHSFLRVQPLESVWSLRDTRGGETGTLELPVLWGTGKVGCVQGTGSQGPRPFTYKT